MFNGLGECFRGAVWESGLGEKLERVAVKVKNKVKKSFQCAKEIKRVQRESRLGG